MGVNNLPRVAAWQCTGRESNPGPLDLETDTLTTTPPSHPACMRVNKIGRDEKEERTRDGNTGWNKSLGWNV